MRRGDFKLLLGISLLILLNFSCGDRSKSSLEKNSEKTLLQQEQQVEIIINEKQETEIIAQIEQLIDITYEQPEKVIYQPDAFLNQLKIQPQSIIGKESYAWLLLNVAYSLRENGELLKSIRYYERAFEYCTQHQLEEPNLVVYIAKPLANLYTRIDDVEKSISLHQRAIAIAITAKNVEHLPSLYNNLAIAYQQQGELDSVLEMSRKGVSSLRNRSWTRASSISLALLYNTMANAFLNTNQVDSAEYFTDKSLQIFNRFTLKEDTLIWYTSCLKLKSDIAKEKNDTKTALWYLNQSITLINTYFPNSKQREKAKYSIARGELNSNINLKLAVQDFYTAMNLLESDSSSMYVSDYTYTHSLHGLAKIYAQENAIDSAIIYYGKAIKNDFQTQQLIVSKASSYKNSEWNRTMLYEYLEVLRKAYSRELEGKEKQRLAYLTFWAIELSKGRQLLMELNRSSKWDKSQVSDETEKAKIEWHHLVQQLVAEKDPKQIKKLKAAIAEFKFKFQLAEKYFEQPFLISDFESFKTYIQQQSESTTLISYLFQEGGPSFIVSINDSQASVKVIQNEQMKQLKLKEFTNDYFADSPYAYENYPAEYARRSEEIAKVVLPFGNRTKQRILFSPDGPLFKLPMDALIQDGSFLAETHTSSYTYSFLLNYLNQAMEVYNAKILLFSKSKHGEGFTDLDFVNEERKIISNHYISQVFQEEEATVKSFLTQLHKPDVLHIATHAVSDDKEEPYLVFENRITLDGLAFIAMQSPLVILSACESASGEIIKAEGLESLNKTFLSKGVKGVVASQWPVDDQVTSQMMKLFYQELYKLKNPMEALASAKRMFIQESEAIHKNPWYWAAMTYMGSDTQIQIQKKSSPWKWGGIGLILFITLIVSRLLLRQRLASLSK